MAFLNHILVGQMASGTIENPEVSQEGSRTGTRQHVLEAAIDLLGGVAGIQLCSYVLWFLVLRIVHKAPAIAI